MALSCNEKDSMADTVSDNSPLSSMDSSKQAEVMLEALKLLVDMANDADDESSESVTLLSTEDALHELFITENHVSQDDILFQLKDCIERLLSTRRVAQQEADAHKQHVQLLQQDMLESNRRIKTLERAVKKLYRRNQVLQQTISDTKETLEQQHQQDQVLAHERLLKLESPSTRRNVAEEEEEDESCSSSVSTMASCITDDGIATVCYDSPAALPYCPPSVLDASTTRSHSTEEYSLQFPQGTKIGLQFCKLQLVEKRGLLNAVIQDDNANACITKTPSTKESSFRHLIRSGKQDSDQHDNMYVVCGHFGFDYDLNTAPSLGAHLIKVNGESTSKMTLDKMKSAIQSNKCEFFSLTFRNAVLRKSQEAMLKRAVQVTHQQYQEAQEEKGRGRSECHGVETDEQQHNKNKPVIICMHDQGDGSTRFASFLHGARKRTLSDGAVRAEGVSRSSAQKAEVPSSEQNVIVSPSTRSFYSILHGSSHGKIDEGFTGESKHSTSERGLSLSDEVSPSGSASRFASMFGGITRSRTFSDNNIMSEGENGDRHEMPRDNPSPSGHHHFYSILHGDTNASSTSSDEVDKTSPSCPADDVPRSGSEGDDEDHKDADAAEEMLHSDSRMSLLFNSVRRRALSETTDETSDPVTSNLESDDVDTPETPRKRLSSFITGGSRNRIDSDPIDSDNSDDTTESGTATSPLPHHPTDESSPTGSSGTFHTGIKSMGSRFRNWAPAVGKST